MMLLGGADNIRPLASLVEADLNKAITDVNSRYTGRMDYATHNKYLGELKRAVGASLVKLEQDVKPVRKVKPGPGPNPYKVGDLISAGWEYSAPKEFMDYANIRVARTTDTYVWLEVVCFKDKSITIWSNTDSAKQAFKNVKAYGKSGGWDNHGHFIPMDDNAHALEWRPIKDYKGRLVRQRWDKIGYRNKHLAQATSSEVGYCYSYEPNYN
jgi:hypothetical protein